jgi:hypothetical protein
MAGNSVPKSNMATTDRLFRQIEIHEDSYHPPNESSQSWYRVLDAGTGDHSLSWLVTLPIEDIVAVTGDSKRAAVMRVEFPQKHVKIVSGNWDDPFFLEGQVFDVVIADYLVGAIEGHAPYFQDQIFQRLFRHVAPGGRLYVVGLQPITMSLEKTELLTSRDKLILEMQRVRDACILLAGHLPYREFPLDWIYRQMTMAGFEVRSQQKFPNIYTAYTIKRQVR